MYLKIRGLGGVAPRLPGKYLDLGKRIAEDKTGKWVNNIAFPPRIPSNSTEHRGVPTERLTLCFEDWDDAIGITAAQVHPASIDNCRVGVLALTLISMCFDTFPCIPENGAIGKQ